MIRPRHVFALWSALPVAALAGCDETSDDEQIESRVRTVQAADGTGTLTLELGELRLDFDAATELETRDDRDLAVGEFVDRVESALAEGRRPSVEVERRRPAADPPGARWPRCDGDTARGTIGRFVLSNRMSPTTPTGLHPRLRPDRRGAAGPSPASPYRTKGRPWTPDTRSSLPPSPCCWQRQR